MTGTKTSAGFTGKTPRNPSGAMPTIVTLRPLIRNVRPIACGSAFRRRRQNESLTTATASDPTRSASGSKKRPAAGVTPRTWKYPGDTR